MINLEDRTEEAKKAYNCKKKLIKTFLIIFNLKNNLNY
jgi:hypothetical protein